MAENQIVVDTDKLSDVGENIQSAIVDDKLVFVVDLKKDMGFTKSEKSIAIASSRGFRQFFDEMRYTLWVGKYV